MLIAFLCSVVIWCGPGVTKIYAVATEALPVVNVEAKTDDEKELVAHWVRAVYPLLASDQQELIRSGLFFVVHYGTDPLDASAGFGPEDDPEYRYPDRLLYPEGTIKINLTGETLRMMRSISDLLDAEARSVLSRYVGEVIAHEIVHVQQYMAHPVLALSRAEECPDGICDDTKLEATRRKMEYEFDAVRYGQEFFVRGLTKEEWERTRAALSHSAGWMSDHRRLPSFETLTSRPLLSPRTRLFYGAMYEPAFFTKKCAVSPLTPEEKKRAREYTEAHPAYRKAIEKAYPHLVPVLSRLSRCITP